MKSVVWVNPVTWQAHAHQHGCTSEQRQDYIAQGWVEFLPPHVEQASSALIDAARGVMRIWDAPEPANYERAEKAFTDLRVATMWAALKSTETTNENQRPAKRDHRGSKVREAG